jgi:hypothetical protein
VSPASSSSLSTTGTGMRHGGRVMERYGVRGTSSGDPSFASDRQRGGIGRPRSERLDELRQVRQLRQSGHEIGAHTGTRRSRHHDWRGSAPRDRIGTQQARARDWRAHHALRVPVRAREQLAAINRVLVRRRVPLLPLRVRRDGARGDDRSTSARRSPWYLSPYQFGFELVTGRVGDRKP